MIEMPTERDPAVVVENDCRTVLHCAELPGVACVITDPPYGISLEAHSADDCMDGTARKRQRGASIGGDESLEVALAVIEWADARGFPLCVFASPYRPLPGAWRNVLGWNKGPAVGGGGDPFKCWKRTLELIYTRRNGNLRTGRDGAVLDFPIGTGSDFEFHPCQKPVALMRYLIRQLTDPGDLILDPCCGSGSTLVAAVAEGRRAIGIEIDPAHAETARQRVAEAMGRGKGSLFTSVV